MTVADSLAAIQERVVRSAMRAGRQRDEIRLVAVCKRQPWARILEAHDAGVRELGESTAQGLRSSAAELQRAGREVRWHFVGALQRNKVNQVLEHASLIHSVDRARLARTISDRVRESGIDVLVQVNVGQEPQKAGVDPDQAVELACAVAQMPGLRLRGLMTLPPAGEDPRPHFETLARLSQMLQSLPEGRDARELSMGMSQDFETAIACGATIIRVGTALFGPRPPRT